MKATGFTLIEVLVVVLIIGILTSVALPQYQKAVLKSQFAQLKALAVSIAEAEEVFYTTYSRYSSRFDELDVDTPAFTNETIETNSTNRSFGWGECWIVGGTAAARVGCYHNFAKMAYYICFEQNTGSSYKGTKMCRGSNQNENSPQNQICKQDTGASSGTKADGVIYWYYQ